VDAFNSEISGLEAQLAADHQTLAALENPLHEGGRIFCRTPFSLTGQAVALRERITEEESKLADLKHAQNLVVEREMKRELDAKNLSKWKALRKECRKFRDEFERAERKALQLRDARETALLKMQQAISRVDEYVNNPPNLDSYFTDEELEDHRLAGVELEEQKLAAGVKYRQIDSDHLKAVMTAVTLKTQFEGAANAERNLRPNDSK
jgi:hypothetical protein